MLTQALLKYHLTYEPLTGIFKWKVPTNTRIRTGDIAGTINYYTAIELLGKKYPAHRLAWLYIYGSMPNLMIDHKDRNKLNNRLDNLRIATRSQNGINSKLSVQNTSGSKGVTWGKDKNRWRAYIVVNHKLIHLGHYRFKEHATNARLKAERKYFGEFASSNGGN